MKKMMQNVQVRMKSGSSDLLIWAFRLCTGALLGLTFALMGEEIIGYGSLSFTFILVTTTCVFLKISEGWGAVSVIVFNLICVLIGMLLRMYVLIAPGA